MKIYQCIWLFLAVSGIPAIKAATTVNIAWYNDNTTGTEFKDHSGILLTAGTSLMGDGAVLQLGYYTGATLADPFVGTWVALTGPGTGLTSTIGDFYPYQNGIFSFGNKFQSDSPNVPAIGTPLAIRFYDTTSLATANYFNCVSKTNGSWNWTLGTPEPTVTLDFKATPQALVWQDGADSAFRTTIAIPEPSAALLAACGALLAFRRRRA